MGLLTRLDSIKEAVKSVGTSDDPAERRQPSGSIPLDMEELDDWLEHGRYSPHVVERPARDSIRGDFEVQVGDETPFEGRLDDLGLKYKMRDALRYARGTGGAGIVIVADDEAPLDEPIHWKTFKKVKALHVFDRWELHPDDHVDDLDDEDYGEPKTYYFHPDKPGQTHDKNGDPVGDEIHHTRVIPYIGRKVRRLRRDEYDHWGQPIPDLLQETLKDLNAGTQAISSSLDEFQYDVFFIDGLRQMITGAEGGEGGKGDNGPLGDLFDAINAAKSYLNAVVLPGEDSSLEKRTIDYSGLIEAVGILKENLSMGSEIPLSVLFGQTPQGLSSNDETGRDNYFDHVREIREEKHNPAIERIVELLSYEKGGGFEGVPNYSIDWGPLDEPSETEQAEVESKEAKALQGDVKLGILSATSATRTSKPTVGASRMLDRRTTRPSKPPTSNPRSSAKRTSATSTPRRAKRHAATARGTTPRPGRVASSAAKLPSQVGVGSGERRRSPAPRERMANIAPTRLAGRAMTSCPSASRRPTRRPDASGSRCSTPSGRSIVICPTTNGSKKRLRLPTSKWTSNETRRPQIRRPDHRATPGVDWVGMGCLRRTPRRARRMTVHLRRPPEGSCNCRRRDAEGPPTNVPRKQVAVLTPDAIEADYRQYLLSRIDTARKLLLDGLDKYLTGRRRDFNRRHRQAQREDGRRRDGTEREDVEALERTISGLKVQWGKKWTEKDTREKVDETAEQIDAFNEQQNRRVIKSVAGLDVADLGGFGADTGELLGQFSQENMELITGRAGLDNQAFQDTREHLVDAVRKGVRHEALAGIVEGRLGVAESRARLIARDQVQKLNSRLNEARQTSLGIERYRWSTAGDERVRPSHEAKAGEIFRWD
ncbi:MAG: anti-CBASS protein Acb1 family protein, partial [Bradymonadaceae bacterium]